jgi:integrase
VLSQILASAVDGGRLPRNVAAGMNLPKVQRREMHFLTAMQVEALAAAIAPPYGVLIRFAAYTGLRPCEFVALKVRRLDLLRGTVRVAEAAPEVAGHLEWGGVKTHEARTVGLPRSVADELGAYQVRFQLQFLQQLDQPPPAVGGLERHRGARRQHAKDRHQLGRIVGDVAVALEDAGVVHDGDLGALAVHVHADVHTHPGPPSPSSN